MNVSKYHTVSPKKKRDPPYILITKFVPEKIENSHSTGNCLLPIYILKIKLRDYLLTEIVAISEILNTNTQF